MDDKKVSSELLKIAKSVMGGSHDSKIASDWKPPRLNKTLAKQVAKYVDKHWSVTEVKSLDDIRQAIGIGVAMGFRKMQDRIDMQSSLKAWMKSISKKDLLQMFRWIEEAKFKGRNVGYRKKDEVLNKLANSVTSVKNDTIVVLKQIVKDHQYQKIDGMVVDATTANAILQVYDNLSPKNQKKYAKMSLKKMSDLAWTILNELK